MAFVLVPFSSFVGVMLAVLLGGKGANKKWFSAGVLFAAGILLSAAFTETIPEAVEIFEQLDVSEFNWATTIVALTFLFLLTVELSAERFLDRLQEQGKVVFHVGHGHREEPEQEKDLENPPTNSDSEDTPSKDDEGASSTISSSTHYGGTKDINPLVSILLVLVLSIHDLFEGLAIGSAGTVEAIRTVFIALAIHRPFAGFALGSSLVASGYWDKPKRKWFWIFVAVYLSMDFIGQGIGLGIESSTSKETDHDRLLVEISPVQSSAHVDNKWVLSPADRLLLAGADGHSHDHDDWESAIAGEEHEHSHSGSDKDGHAHTEGETSETNDHSHHPNGDANHEHTTGSSKEEEAHEYDEEDSSGHSHSETTEILHENNEDGHSHQKGGDSHGHDDATLADGIFHSLLGGSFLFITLAELIPIELEKTRMHRFPIALMMGSLIAGFAVFSLIGHYTGHSH